MHLPEFDAYPVHSALRASGIGRIKIQCVCIGFVYILLEKVHAHLLTSNHDYYLHIRNLLCSFPLLLKVYFKTIS